jgi:DNA-binding CsgD family transcriptional regulator
MSDRFRNGAAASLQREAEPGAAVPGFFAPFRFDQDPLKSFLSFSEIIASAVAALDNDRRLRGYNRTFAGLLQEGDGLRVSGDTVTTVAHDDAEKLATSLSVIARVKTDKAEDASASPAQLFSILRCGRTALHCAIVPASSLFGSTKVDASAIMFVSDPEQCQPDSIRSVCALYQLTPAETQLALYLVQGYNTADIATVMDLKEETIRAYLKHIYTKTDTNRQPELIQLLLASRLPLIIPGVQQPIVSRTRRRH